MSDLTGVVPGPSEIAGLFDWSTALETLRTLGTDVAAAPSVADACSAIQQVLAACKEFNVQCGYPATENDIETRIKQGFSVFIMNWGDPGFRAVDIGRRVTGR